LKDGDYMKKKIAFVIAFIALFGVISTILATGLDNPLTPWASALSTLKYFTIQSNIIVILYFALFSFGKLRDNTMFIKLIGAVVVYITITFLVFAVMLQGTWNPVGLALLGSVLNHYVVPLMVISFFITYRKKYQFVKKDILQWLVYPLVYLLFLIIHGIISNDYIYPFFEIDDYGLLYFLVAFIGIMTLFFILSFGAILLTKKKN